MVLGRKLHMVAKLVRLRSGICTKAIFENRNEPLLAFRWRRCAKSICKSCEAVVAFHSLGWAKSILESCIEYIVSEWHGCCTLNEEGKHQPSLYAVESQRSKESKCSEQGALGADR